MTVDVIQRGEALAIFERSDHPLSADIKGRCLVCASLIGRSQKSPRGLSKGR